MLNIFQEQKLILTSIVSLTYETIFERFDFIGVYLQIGSKLFHCS
jgi:hypothetical protein